MWWCASKGQALESEGADGHREQNNLSVSAVDLELAPGALPSLKSAAPTERLVQQ